MRLQQLVTEQNATEQHRRQRAKEMLAAWLSMHFGRWKKLGWAWKSWNDLLGGGFSRFVIYNYVTPIPWQKNDPIWRLAHIFEKSVDGWFNHQVVWGWLAQSLKLLAKWGVFFLECRNVLGNSGSPKLRGGCMEAKCPMRFVSGDWSPPRKLISWEYDDGCLLECENRS